MTVPSNRLLLVSLIIGCSSGTSLSEKINSENESSPPLVTEVRSTGANAEADSGATVQPAPAVIDETEKESAIVVVEVICRDAWGAQRPTREYTRHEIRKLTIHHQGVVFEDNRKAPRRLRTMQRFHQGPEKNFADIAYHYVIDFEGNIYEGRPTWAAGETGTDYDPTNHLLVCLLGNFEEQTPTNQQIDALVSLLIWASKEFKVPTSAIEGHRDHAHTLCPGKNLHRMISTDIRSRVSEATKTNFTMKSLCGDAGETRLSEISNHAAVGSDVENTEQGGP